MWCICFFVLWFLFCVWLCVVCFPALCAVLCRGQWSVAQYARGATSTYKGAEGADSNSGPGERDAGEEMFTTESAHRASPAGALPTSHRERKLHRYLLTRCYPTVLTEPNIKGIVPPKMKILSWCHHLLTHTASYPYDFLSFAGGEFLNNILIKWKKTWALKSQSFCMTSEDFRL